VEGGGMKDNGKVIKMNKGKNNKRGKGKYTPFHYFFFTMKKEIFLLEKKKNKNGRGGNNKMK
jgi:hypothetical protein